MPRRQYRCPAHGSDDTATQMLHSPFPSRNARGLSSATYRAHHAPPSPPHAKVARSTTTITSLDCVARCQEPARSTKEDELITVGTRADIHPRSTFPRPDEPTARARTARSTPSTRLPVSRPGYSTLRTHTENWQSTRQERPRCSLRESVVMIASSPVTEVRPSPSSTRYDRRMFQF
jgi:hypothetical protein